MAFKLDNGLEVVLEENHAAPVVAFQAWVKIGSADEPPELAGIAHLFEHMLFKGTKKRGVGQIAREVESAGGEINAWTSHDETVYHLVLASRYFDTGLDILADTLMNSSFDAGELERERKVVLEEIKQGMDDPERQASHGLFRTLFDAHPYGRPILGSDSTVRKLRRQDVLAFFAQRYVARNLTLVVVGDFDADVARKKIASAFAAMPEGEPAAPRPSQPAQTTLRVQGKSRDVKEAQLLFGFATPAISHPDIAALDLLAVLLGQGDSSRLNLEVVRNRQAATGISAYLFSARDPGALVVGANLPPARIEDATRAVLDEVCRLAYEDIPAEELAKAKTILESDRVYDKETVQGYARKLGFFSAIAGDPDFEERYLAALQKTSAADLRRIAAKYLRTANLSIYVQVPDRLGNRQLVDTDKILARVRAVAENAEARMHVRLAHTAASAPDMDRVIRHVLPSGMKLLILRDASVPIVALRATWVGGLRYEDARSNGISNMLAALLTRGTRTHNAEQIMNEVESMAGALTGYSGRNSLGLQAEFLSRYFERGLGLVADCLLHATFPADELDKERRIVLDDIRAQQDNLGQVAFKLFHTAMWQNHPYRLDPMGTAASVAGLTRRKLLNHFRQRYSTSNLTIAVVGDVDPARVRAKAATLFGGSGEQPLEKPVVPSEAPQTEPAQVFEFMAKEQAHLVLGYRGVSYASQDRFPLEVLAYVLSGQGGRLFTEIREKRALAYRVSAFSVEGLDPGYFAVYLASSPTNLEEAIRVVREELREITAKGITADELARAQRYLVGVHAIGLQRKSALAAALAFHEAYGQGWKAYRQYSDNIMKVKASDVTRVARKYLDPAREVTAIVKPPAESPGAARAAARSRRGGLKSMRFVESVPALPASCSARSDSDWK
ncbi:MAG: insulinase family protein [Deltaproteobacteria bacterium]|nr:insulinase family protein [Deltaproteobacteria bacterium]